MLTQRWALPSALICSGFAALAVEVLWQRLLTPVLGGSTLAVTAVLMATMGGLALGAAIAGRIGDRLSPAQALRGYRLIELGVWLAATATTLVLTLLPVGVAGILSELPQGAPRFAARFLILTELLARDSSQKEMAALLSRTPEQLAGMRRGAEDQEQQRLRELDFVIHPL
jgi:hypothetical protein